MNAFSRTALTVLIFPAWLLPVPAQESAPAAATAPPADIPALVKQLGSPYVRLRDEAEARLREVPEASEALQALVRSEPGSEAGLRAAHVGEFLKHSLWVKTAELRIQGDDGNGSPGMAMLRSLAASPDGGHVVALFRGGASVLSTNPLAEERRDGPPGNLFNESWNGVRRALAISPDGGLYAHADDEGLVRIQDFKGALVLSVRPPMPAPVESTVRTMVEGTLTTTIKKYYPKPDAMVIWGLAFLPGGGELVMLDGNNGLMVQDLKSGERRALAFPDMRPRCLAVSRDGKLAAVSLSPLGADSWLMVVNLERLSRVKEWTLQRIPSGLSLNEDGSRLLLAMDDGSVQEMDTGTGRLRPLHQFRNQATSVAYSADGNKILATSLDSTEPLLLLNAKDGAVEWSAPAADRGNHSAVWLDDRRFVSSSHDDFVRLWTKRGSSGPPAAAPAAIPAASKPE